MSYNSRYQKVCDVCTNKVITCAKHTPLIEAVKLMRAHNVSAIFIQDKHKIVGVWTESDCLTLDFTNQTLKKVAIQKVMSSPVLRVSNQQLLTDTALVFNKHGVRHLLVTDDNNVPSGVISITDIVRNQGLEHYLQFRPINEQYNKDIRIVPSSLDINEAVTLMRELCEKVILVFNEIENTFGIITQRDLLKLITKQHNHKVCWDLASRPLYQVTTKDSLFDAYRLMSESNIRHLVINDNDKIKGVLSLEHLISEIEIAYCYELEKALEQRDVALQHSQRNLYLANKIIDSSLDGIMITDSNAIIIQVNPAFSELTGYKEYEVIGKRPNMLSSGRHDKNFYIKMWDSLVKKGVWQGEIHNRKKEW